MLEKFQNNVTVKTEKIADSRFNDGEHPKGHFIGKIRIGTMVYYPMVGASFMMSNQNLITSKVTKITEVDDETLIIDTKNSSYKITIVNHE